MGRLLGQSHPHLVLLGALAAQEGKDSYDDEDEHHAQLDEGVAGQALKHDALVVAHFHEGSFVLVQLYSDGTPSGFHRQGFLQDDLVDVGGIASTHFQVAIGLHLPVFVQDDHGNRVVAVDDFQHEGEVGLVVR